MTRGIKLYRYGEREFGAKERTDFGGGKEHIFEKQQEASVAGEKWRMDRVRGDEVGETERASSCSEGMELKFSSKCYVKPLKVFLRKKKMCYSLGVLDAWHITGVWNLDERAEIMHINCSSNKEVFRN